MKKIASEKNLIKGQRWNRYSNATNLNTLPKKNMTKCYSTTKFAKTHNDDSNILTFEVNKN